MKSLSNVFAVLVIGLTFGWLIGMAVSPVINTVITSLVALLVTLATVLAGIKMDKTDTTETKPSRVAVIAELMRNRVSPWPIAFLLVGIVLGAGIGLHVRTNGYLISPNKTESQIINDEINMWVALGRDRNEVINTVYCSYYQLPMQMHFEDSGVGIITVTPTDTIKPTSEVVITPARSGAWSIVGPLHPGATGYISNLPETLRTNDSMK